MAQKKTPLEALTEFEERINKDKKITERKRIDGSTK
jgi:hypothetical protein